MIGLVSYGTYVPRYRLPVGEIAAVWGKNPAEIIVSLGVSEKSVSAPDEDAVTLAIEAARSALIHGGIDAASIGALFVGSESHPYAVNPSSTIVGELLGVGNNYLASDMEFACKAGTAGMQAIAGLVSAGNINVGMAIGSDTAQSRPHDVLEYTSAAASAACIIGTRAVAAVLLAFTSYSSDTPDFWRRDGIRYPSHAGRFTGEPAYFAHIMGAAARLKEKTGVDPKNADYCVFHMPNGKFPRDAARRLGVDMEKIRSSLTVDSIGNPYSASAMLGFCALLDVIEPDKTIFMVSYGSGAGSDAFLWKTTENIRKIQKKRKALKYNVQSQIANRKQISYTDYLKYTHKI